MECRYLDDARHQQRQGHLALRIALAGGEVIGLGKDFLIIRAHWFS